MKLKGGYARCEKCRSKDAYSIMDSRGKGICVGRRKQPKPHPSDNYAVCFVGGSKIVRYGVSRSELQMLCAAANFLLLLEEIGKWE